MQRVRAEAISTDECLFSISKVPIKFFCGTGDTKTINWKNPATSSTRYCRPIKLVFAKESTDLITKAVNLRQQIEMLTPTIVSLGNLDIIIIPTMILCMIFDFLMGQRIDNINIILRTVDLFISVTLDNIV